MFFDAAQRLRVANDLQDLVVHRVSAIEVQAAATLPRLGGAPEERRAVAAMLDLAHEAMAELGRLRRLLSGELPPPLEPAPSLRALPALTATGARRGVTLSVVGAEGVEEIPPGIALSAFRCIETLAAQCADTGGGTVEVEVRQRAAVLVLSVSVPAAADPDALREWLRPCAGTLRERGEGRFDLELPWSP